MRVPMKHALPVRTPGRVSMTVVRSIGLHGTTTHRTAGRGLLATGRLSMRTRGGVTLMGPTISFGWWTRLGSEPLVGEHCSTLEPSRFLTLDRAPTGR